MQRKLIILMTILTLLFALRSNSHAQEDRPELPYPQRVTITGNFQSQSLFGCPGDWDSKCEATLLGFNADGLIYRATWEIEAGEYEYKAVLNETPSDNFGLNAEYDGENIPLSLEEETAVTFYYSHETNWVTDDVNSIIANVPGTFQSEIGCPDDWQPSCLRSWLQDPDGDGVYTFVTTWIPAGNHEAKVAVNGSWSENYGEGGTSGGENIPFSVPADAQVTFAWDSESKLLTIETTEAPPNSATSPPEVDIPSVKPQPSAATIPGTIQSVLGCSGDWQPECEATALTLDRGDKIWKGSWSLPAGSYEYKVALNKSWDENYGINAQPGGANIPLVIAEDGLVRFYYDHQTNWVADSINKTIAVVIGDFQSTLGCENENDPTCFRSWLQDPDGDGVYAFLARGIPPGDYSARVAIDESLDLTYGAEGVEGGEDILFTVDEEGKEVYFEYDQETNVLIINTEGAPIGDLGTSKAHWLSADTIAWMTPAEAESYQLMYAFDGGLSLSPNGVEGGLTLEIKPSVRAMPGSLLLKFPHLRAHTILKIDPTDLSLVPEILQGQIAIAAFDAEGKPLDATSLQIPGVLDDLYTYDGPLGISWEDKVPTFRVWAPTAQSVGLLVFDNPTGDDDPQAVDMARDGENGVWTVTGQADWAGKYYLYEVKVYVPSAAEVLLNQVTDPYSVGLSTNSTRSLIVDLSETTLYPEGWENIIKPPLEAPEDIVLYELHVRDFSMNDPAVPDELRGTFAAFTVAESNGMAHLRALADSGLTHLHLLPAFDIATINEDKSTWDLVNFETLREFPPDSAEQQAVLAPSRGEDGYNWGYDPFHYGVPEGSYSTDPSGSARTLEFRQMVQALNEAGLRVVMDVVYNHTNASGQSDKSVLDKVVPGYYHRLNGLGRVENSTCCQNTATEHNMMRKLMVDTLVIWAKAYKVDGFRFDLMGHHMVADMEAVQKALAALTLEADGVDGSQIYLYGEGWNFGELAANARGVNATQTNMAGTGIGTFNDRVRDAVRGGSAFGGHLDQGFATGLYTDPNETAPDPGTAKSILLRYSDQIRVALSGNLADFSFVDHTGREVTGAQVDYNGSPAGYTQDPQEQIFYISAHDNETLFDAVQFKAPGSATITDRVRMQNMGLSLVGLSQGVPFFHAGADMLRSKSFDRDSFDSGDWFNRLDFTYQESGWGSGLPPASKNQDNWGIMAPRLANPDIAPSSENILAAVQHLREILQIRKSTPLFRLQTEGEVRERMQFHNTGPDQVPGLIIMSISDMVGEDLDPENEMVVVFFNSDKNDHRFSIEEFAGMSFKLHPVQANSADSVIQGASYDPSTGEFAVPGRTTAVFIAAKAPVNVEIPTMEPVATRPPQPSPVSTQDDIAPQVQPETIALGLLGVFVLIFLAAFGIRRQRKT